MAEYETDYELEEEATEPEDTEGSYQEETEADPDESQKEEAGEDQSEEDQSEEETGSDESEEEPEEEAAGEEAAEENPEEDPETVSGNDLVISGDVIVLPEGCDLSDLEGEQLDVEQIVQAIENVTRHFVVDGKSILFSTV